MSNQNNFSLNDQAAYQQGDDAQEQTSLRLDNFPANEPEIHTSQPYISEKLLPTRLSEDLGEAGKAGAVVYIQNRSSGKIAWRTSDFYLTQMAIGLKERTQILETFGTTNISFFGESVRVYNFAGAVLDWGSQSGSAEYYHASSLIHLYNNQMRGTELVNTNSIAVMKILNHTVFGYPLALNVNYDQSRDKMATFSLSWLVSKHLLGVPGIVSESQLESNSAATQRTGLSQLMKDQLSRIDGSVATVMSAIEVTEENHPDSFDKDGKGNSLSGKSVEELKKIHEEKSLVDVFKIVKEQFIEMRELGDGQVSPTISQIFGSTEEQLEAWFDEMVVAIEQLTNEGTLDVQTPLSLFRTKLTRLKDFANILTSLANAIQG